MDWSTFFQPIINLYFNIYNNRNLNILFFDQLKTGKDWTQSDFINLCIPYGYYRNSLYFLKISSNPYNDTFSKPLNDRDHSIPHPQTLCMIPWNLKRKTRIIFSLLIPHTLKPTYLNLETTLYILHMVPFLLLYLPFCKNVPFFSWKIFPRHFRRWGGPMCPHKKKKKKKSFNFDKFIFQKRGLKLFFSANHGAAICRIRKKAAFWLAEKILLIPFVRINKLNVFAGLLPTEN